MPNSMLLLMCLYFGFIGIASGDCFWIDGSVAKGHTACYDLNTVGASMCCAKDSPNFGSCTPGGLCQYLGFSGAQGPLDNGTSFWRDSCSDRTWLDPACLAMAPYVKSSDVRLNKCADGSFCPRTENDVNMTCCNNRQGQNATNLGATLPASPTTSVEDPGRAASTPTSVSALLSHTTTPPSGLTSSATSADALTPSSTSSHTPGPSPGRTDGLSKAEKIATVLGSVVGVVSLGVGLTFGINGWKKHRHREAPTQ